MRERGTRIGLLGPYAELPGEYVDVAAKAKPSALVWQVVTESVDSHELDDLASLARREVLAAGARRLLRWGPDVAMWACTSGSFVLGREEAIAQRRLLEAELGVPASSTSLAFVDALRVLSVQTVSLLSPYPEPATRRFVEFLAEWGIEVTSAVHLDCPGARWSELLSVRRLLPGLEKLGTSHPILLPDTAVWGFEVLNELTDHPSLLLTANQVTLWLAFRLAGMDTDIPAFGLLRGRT
jgi:maleate cis-trans isomerase